MNTSRISKPSLMLALAALTVGLAGTTTAVANQHEPEAPHSHDAAHRAQNLVVQTQNDARVLTNTTLQSFTADTVKIPASGTYRVLVRFSGESDCQASSWCSAQINVNGIEAHPQSGSDFAFDSKGGNLWTSNSFERISAPITGDGTVRNVTVEVLAAAIGGGSWRLDDWTVVAQVFRV